MIEIGKKEWLWGKGFSFIPTCPLVKEENYPSEEEDQRKYLGMEYSVPFDNWSLALGGAQNNDNPEFEVAWLRFSFLYQNSDFEPVLSYKKMGLQENSNLGCDYSHDFLNGWELHTGFNHTFPDNTQQYLIGCQYISEKNITNTFEYYYDNYYHYFSMIFNNSSKAFGNWQWELKEIKNLDDNGEMRTFSIKYVKNNKLVPELLLTNYVGPETSEFGKNLYDFNCSLKITMKF